MKQILLSEGKYDVFFLKEFYEQNNYEVDTFIKEKLKGSTGRNKQASSIRSFIESRSPYEILIKSEGGKPPLIDFFSRQVIHLIRKIDKVILIIDLDSADDRGLSSLKKDLSERIEERHKGSDFKISSHTIINKNECLVALKVSIQDSGEFNIIGCKPNLETMAGIEKSNDSEDEKKEKILQLLKDDRIGNFLEEVLI